MTKTPYVVDTNGGPVGFSTELVNTEEVYIVF